ncbi:MAG TPA: hypothetical protein VFG08_02585 [Candidatus Polarisedimenticolia bacterium]|nr:hypothetical protein [Candidatus Polarisedimenticolia bacterium]
MTPLARRRLQLRMKKAFKMSVKARKAHKRAVSNYRKLQKRYKAA